MRAHGHPGLQGQRHRALAGESPTSSSRVRATPPRAPSATAGATGGLDTALEAIVARQLAPVLELLEGLEPVPRPELLTPTQLGDALQVSVRTIATLRSRGMPVVMVGDSPRYRLEAVLEFLEGKGQS